MPEINRVKPHPSLLAAITLHKTANDYFNSVLDFSGAMELGREPTPSEAQVWEAACDAERAALLALCALPFNDPPSQKVKAEYLLDFLGRNELDHEHYNAVLQSLTDAVQGMGRDMADKAKAPAAAAVCSPLSEAERVELAAKELAAALESMHGGFWDVHIAHDVGLVAVSRDFSRRASGRAAA